MRAIESVLVAAGLSVVLAVSFTSGPASAHHSFGHYKMDAVSEIEGTVHRYEWTNPHCWLFVDVVAAGGAPVTYGFELSSVGEMFRRGWRKTSVNYGEKVKVKFRPMHDGTPAGLMVSVEKNGSPIGANLAGSDPAPILR